MTSTLPSASFIEPNKGENETSTYKIHHNLLRTTPIRSHPNIHPINGSLKPESFLKLRDRGLENYYLDLKPSLSSSGGEGVPISRSPKLWSEHMETNHNEDHPPESPRDPNAGESYTGSEPIILDSTFLPRVEP